MPILKQLNRQNEDGSYSYGYENADGSYKIETKSAAGEIVGKYGYIDESGKLREIEYGASRRGFEVAGPGIPVPPPTAQVQSENTIEEYDDGQYHEDPSIYYKTDKPLTSKIAAPRPTPSAAFAAPNFRLESQYNPQQAQPAPVDYNWYRQPQNAQYNPNIFQGHPATNFDPFSGSYTINYSG